MVLAMIVLIALATLSGLTVVSVQGGQATATADRFHTIAVYAAESGGAVAMDFLRTNVNPSTFWSAYVTPANAQPWWPGAGSGGIPGNNVASGLVGNPFDLEQRASYSVQIYNNRTDTGLAGGTDLDADVIIRSTGYGPNGAVAIIEWEVKASSSSATRPCPSYGQKGESEDNSGRNDCLSAINTADQATYHP